MGVEDLEGVDWSQEGSREVEGAVVVGETEEEGGVVDRRAA